MEKPLHAHCLVLVKVERVVQVESCGVLVESPKQQAGGGIQFNFLTFRAQMFDNNWKQRWFHDLIW